MANQKSPEKSISERILEILPQLSYDQRRFVAAMQRFSTKRAAAEALDLKPDTVYHWPDIVDEATDLCSADAFLFAQGLRKRALAEAMLVKVAGLHSEDERIRQSAASEIIEWEMGKANQPVDLSLVKELDLSFEES